MSQDPKGWEGEIGAPRRQLARLVRRRGRDPRRPWPHQILLARGEVLPRIGDEDERHHFVGVAVVTLALGLAIGALWEIFEYLSDRVFGSHLQHGQTDTITDLVADSCGAAAGGLLLVVWYVKGWASERPRPS